MARASRETALREAYWKLRDHAQRYRDTEIFRRTREAWQAGEAGAYKRHIVHEFYARGLEWAARDIAEMLGVPEHEITREGQ